MRLRLVEMARRKVRRKQRKVTNRKLTSGRITKNPMLLKPALICPQKYLLQWKSTKRCSSSYAFILHSQLLPWG